MACKGRKKNPTQLYFNLETIKTFLTRVLLSGSEKINSLCRRLRGSLDFAFDISCLQILAEDLLEHYHVKATSFIW